MWEYSPKGKGLFLKACMVEQAGATSTGRGGCLLAYSHVPSTIQHQVL